VRSDQQQDASARQRRGVSAYSERTKPPPRAPAGRRTARRRAARNAADAAGPQITKALRGTAGRRAAPPEMMRSEGGRTRGQGSARRTWWRRSCGRRAHQQRPSRVEAHRNDGEADRRSAAAPAEQQAQRKAHTAMPARSSEMRRCRDGRCQRMSSRTSVSASNDPSMHVHHQLESEGRTR